ncbi:hypothetical protein V492_05863 [Pseudogymnoascus sp. VKM F-4246]|nr:hypothetical protein V492_05863 [Pseudogymnoascus sp. VKM F-4246]
MAHWKIESCTFDDAQALARNNMSAFWEDPTWILMWPNIKLDFIIEQSAKRQPRNLLRNREQMRHLKAINPTTGAVVGYARWELPSSHCITAEGTPVWAEFQMPDVSDEEQKRFNELAESSWWKARSDMSEIDDKNMEAMKRILAKKLYMKLDLLAVHPNSKGKGIGTALVASGVQLAEKIGVPIFVMAYKAGRGIYSRLGFQEVDRVIQDDSQFGGAGEYGAYFMVYEVKR